MIQYHVHNQPLGLEKIGIYPGQTDFNIDRIVRMAAMATDCEEAGFSIFSRGMRVDVATHGGQIHIGPDAISVAALVMAWGQPIYQDGKNLVLPNQPDGFSGAVAAAPVLTPKGDVIGVLWLGRRSPVSLQNDANWKVINDCVRLIEDSLSLRQTALRDELTGLYNRRFFDEQLQSEWHRCLRREEPMSLLLLDLDRFKSINDTAGHCAGDRVIRQVANVLEGQSHRAGDSISRYGGEEFAILKPGCTAQASVKLANALRAAVETAGLAHPGESVRDGGVVTVSVGVVTLLPSPCGSVQELIHAADQAMYAAKRSGRNQVCQAAVTSQEQAA